MRAQTFLRHMMTYNFHKAHELAAWMGFRGGWEVWLQVEIAAHMHSYTGFQSFDREVVYPNPRYPGYICDFRVKAPEGTLPDETYVELKCINPTVDVARALPLQDAFARFYNDIGKITMLRSNTYNCFAVLAVNGRITTDPFRRVPVILRTDRRLGQPEQFELRRLAAPYKSVYLLVPGEAPREIKGDFTTPDKNDNLFLIAVTDNQLVQEEN